jgi:hypothetical protein
MIRVMKEQLTLDAQQHRPLLYGDGYAAEAIVDICLTLIK